MLLQSNVAVGQYGRIPHVRVTSGHPQIAAMLLHRMIRRSVPIDDICSAVKCSAIQSHSWQAQGAWSIIADRRSVMQSLFGVRPMAPILAYQAMADSSY